jgi:hypothetical protein
MGGGPPPARHPRSCRSACCPCRDQTGYVTREEVIRLAPTLQLVAVAAPVLLGEQAPKALAAARAEDGPRKQHRQLQELLTEVLTAAWAEVDVQQQGRIPGEATAALASVPTRLAREPRGAPTPLAVEPHYPGPCPLRMLLIPACFRV